MILRDLYRVVQKMAQFFGTLVIFHHILTDFQNISLSESEENVFIFSVIVQSNSNAAFFTSNVQFVHLAAGRPTQAGNATDQWRDR